MSGWLAGLAQAAGGLLLIGLVLWDIFQTVVLPRPAPTRVRIARNLVRLTWPLWRWRALQRTSSIDQEKLLGSYAPATVLILLITWFLVMVLGFGLLLYSLRDGLQPVSDFGSILYYAGTSLLTIGFGDITATHGLARGVSVVAGGLGLGILALGITYLFSLYGSFQRREILVVRLEARAGAPPSGIRLLESYGAKDLRAGLAAFFLEWEAWAAEVLDSHVAYPLLGFFRSSHDNLSWISALGTVLDAASLVLTTIRDVPRGEAKLFKRVGTHLVEDIYNVGFRLGEPTSLDRSDYEAACARLAEAGYTLAPLADAWPAFEAARATYAVRLESMARYWATPATSWLGDPVALRTPLHRTDDP